jgi:hypothetical protein
MIAALPALVRPPRRLGARVLAALLLAAITCVPSMARVHDRLDHQRTPAQEHSRFRWSNSCASVPQKQATTAVATPADCPPETIVEFTPRIARAVTRTDAPLPHSLRIRSPHGFRAPPANLR